MGQVFGKIDVETAKFVVVKRFDFFEVRQYKPAIAVETKCSDIDGKDNKEAFQRLANYIGVMKTKSENETGEKISMTAPVMNVCTVDNGGAMMFILPGTFDKNNSPKPTDEKVHLVEIPEQYKVSTQFNGVCSEKDAKQVAFELVEKIKAESCISIPEKIQEKIDAGEQFYEIARYNPPWTIPSKRTNEVHIVVDYCEQ